MLRFGLGQRQMWAHWPRSPGAAGGVTAALCQVRGHGGFPETVPSREGMGGPEIEPWLQAQGHQRVHLLQKESAGWEGFRVPGVRCGMGASGLQGCEQRLRGRKAQGAR